MNIIILTAICVSIILSATMVVIMVTRKLMLTITMSRELVRELRTATSNLDKVQSLLSQQTFALHEETKQLENRLHNSGTLKHDINNLIFKLEDKEKLLRKSYSEMEHLQTELFSKISNLAAINRPAIFNHETKNSQSENYSTYHLKQHLDLL